MDSTSDVRSLTYNLPSEPIDIAFPGSSETCKTSNTSNPPNNILPVSLSSVIRSKTDLLSWLCNLLSSFVIKPEIDSFNANAS